MTGATLELLHQKTLAISLKIGENAVMLNGIGSVDVDAQLGDVLRIPIHDPAGDFEILLCQSEWNGEFGSGSEFGCDYLLHLGNNCPALVGSAC